MDERNIITDKQVVKRAREAVRLELEKMKALDIPVVIYDRDTEKIYKVYSDGTREEAGKRIEEGSYSERVGKKA